MELNLVKITDTSGQVTGEIGKVTYQVLTDDQLDNLLVMESDYSYINGGFRADHLGTINFDGVDSYYETLKSITKIIADEANGQLDYALIPINLIEQLNQILKEMEDD